MLPRAVYLTLPAAALDHLFSEAASAGIGPLWMLAARAAELRDGIWPAASAEARW